MIKLIPFVFIILPAAIASNVTISTKEESRVKGGPVTLQITEHRRDSELRLRYVRRDSNDDGNFDQTMLYVYKSGKAIASYVHTPAKGELYSVHSQSDVDVSFDVSEADKSLQSVILSGSDYFEIIYKNDSSWRLATDQELSKEKKGMEMWK